MKTQSLGLVILALAASFGASAQAQVLVDQDPVVYFSFSGTDGGALNTITGSIDVVGGQATEIDVNPFTLHNGSSSFDVPALQWLPTAGSNNGEIRFDAAPLTAGNVINTNADYNIIGFDYTPAGGTMDFSIGFTQGLADFSAGYPGGTFFANSPSGDATFSTVPFEATPEPAAWALMLGGLLALVPVLRRRANRA